jgi:hypothetical protein
MTLLEWQTYKKPCSELLYNCSEFKYQNDEWVDFPIGMGWKFIYHREQEFLKNDNHSQLVLCAINTYTDRRRRPIGGRDAILKILNNNGISNNLFSSNDYFNTLSKYKFIVSPEGNGVDCHRHYEALMAGAIPIVETHPGIAMKYEGCPILFTKDYSEINEVYLAEKYEMMKNTIYDFSKLFLSNYEKEIQNTIKSNGNYWGERLSGKKWYTVEILN